ncbi:MAG: glycosyltransferase [Deltaproteobacteria bacterium]
MELRERKGKIVRRIMVYTHNSIGLGHAVRTMALIDGMRRANPGIECLVLSGTSAPQIFLDQGVEIIRLPGVRHALDLPGHPFLPRNLDSFSINELIAWRRKIIDECLLHFNPEVIMIEHSLAGLMGEVSPLLAARAAHYPANASPALIHLSRGIYRFDPQFIAAPDDFPGLPPNTNILRLYDAFYVFEEKKMVDVNREFFGHDPTIESKIRYMGRISARNADELGNPKEFPGAPWARNKPFILFLLGRFGEIEDLHLRILRVFRHLGLDKGRDILIVPDVYLKPETLKALKAHPEFRDVQFTPFIPHLVDVMAKSDLVVCRAGYNIINEVMLTGVKAVIIPEAHPSGEQERRTASLSGDGLLVRNERSCLSDDIEDDLNTMMHQPPRPSSGDYDRFRIGRIIVEELEELLSRRSQDLE